MSCFIILYLTYILSRIHIFLLICIGFDCLISYFYEFSCCFTFSLCCYSSSELSFCVLQIPPGIYDKGGQTLNRKSIYITKNSSTQVCEAYATQFDKDFSAFLKARSAEVVCGGRVVLLMAGRNGPGYFSSDDTFYWDLLYQSFLTLVSKVIN